jgi:hypothetical protein
MKLRARLGGRGLAIDALVAGDFGVKRVRRAIVSPNMPRTLVNSDVAAEITRAAGPERCTRLMPFGKVCAPSACVAVALKGRPAVNVRAVAAPMPRGVDLVLGRDVLSPGGKHRRRT